MELKTQQIETSTSSEASSSGTQSREDGSTSSSSSATEFEGVSASQFEDFQKDLNMHLDFLTTSAIVLIFAILFCCGVIAVQTLIKSFEVK